MLKRFWIVVLYVCISFPSSDSKVYNKCELAKDLLNKHGFDKTYLANWICLAKHESELNTKSIVPNRNQSKQYGLFGINSNLYCKEDRKGGLCDKNCKDFIDDDITDDAQCAKKILDKDGFKSWANWKRSCSLNANLPNLRILWICLVKHESNYNTAAVIERGGRRRRYGLFGITSQTFCKENSKKGLCGKKCEDFTDDDIVDDVECAKIIFEMEGFKHWTGWNSKCKNKELRNIPNLRQECDI